MSSKIPKTGLAARMRAWMQARPGRFTAQDLCDGLGLSPGKERDRARVALGDFIARGELAVVTDKRIRRQNKYSGMIDHPRRARTYQYVSRADVGARTADVKNKIYKAMRLLSFKDAWAVSDIMRLTDLKRSHIEKTARRLREADWLRIDGQRLPPHRAGREILYRIPHDKMDRFRLEVMK